MVQAGPVRTRRWTGTVITSYSIHYTKLYDSFAPIGAALFGFLYAPLVITGVHHTTNAVDLQLMQSMGGTRNNFV